MKIPTPVDIPEPTFVHSEPCYHCPSVNSSDEESAMIKLESKEYRVSRAFPCAWRREGICRGYCDSMGLEDSDLKL